MNFSKITSCGGDCAGCEYFQKKECDGCIKNGGKCVKMWESGCPICKCCEEHHVLFCGLCGEFPCEWLKNTLTWEKDGIGHLKECAKAYREHAGAFLKLWGFIGTHGVMTLSTCSQNRVTSRPMSVVVINGKFYCQTDESYLKCRQIRENPNAALCYQNFSIEGKCRIIGKAAENPFFIKAMREHFPNAVERWSALPTECVIEIMPVRVSLWEYENDKPYMEYWDFECRTYRKEWK